MVALPRAKAVRLVLPLVLASCGSSSDKTNAAHAIGPGGSTSATSSASAVSSASSTTSTSSSGTGGSDAGAMGNDAGAGGADASSCALLGTAICEKYAQCAPFYVDATYGGVARCADRYASSQCGASTAAVPDPSACTAALANASCDLFLSGSVSECDPKGTLADAAPCAQSIECISGSCPVEDGVLCGTCQPSIAEGGACGAPSQMCAKGTVCKNSVCTKLALPGEPCATYTDCSGPLLCVGGQCTRGASEGETCTFKTNDLPCDNFAGLFCSNATAKCKAMKLAEPGQSCGYDAATDDVVRCKNGTCINASCVSHLHDGDACSPIMASGLPTCEAPSRCVAETCQLPALGLCH